MHARGYWALESVDVALDAGTTAADGGTASDTDRPATRVRLRIEFDRRCSRLGRLRLPPMDSTDRVLRRLEPLEAREAEQEFERAVADLEGERRRVDLEVHARPSTS